MSARFSDSFTPSGRSLRCRAVRCHSRWCCMSWPSYQSNKLACGGARQGGSREPTTEASFLSRWVRIFSMTAGSSMHIWTHPVLQNTVSIATRKRLLPYIRPIDADLLPLALMNSARLDLNRRSASNKATASIRFSKRRSDLSRHQSLLCPRNLLTGFRVHYWIFKPIL